MILFKEFLRFLLGMYFALQDLVVGAYARIARRKSLLRERVAGADPHRLSRRAAVYVHFDRRGAVHDYVLHQLRELAEAGFRVTFVSNAPSLPEDSRQRVTPYCKEILWRFNTGYDFGAYKDGIASIEQRDQLDALVLMNDSVYGPFWPIAQTLAAMDLTKADFWGIADSWEIRYHIQTFFMLLSPKAIRSDAFARFWRRIPYVDNKWWVIRNGEIGFTQTLAKHGLRGAVLAPYWSAAEKMKDRLAGLDLAKLAPDERRELGRLHEILLTGRPVNSMHFFWDVLITDYRCPFVKRELLQSNPAKVPFTATYPDLLRQHSSYDPGMIQDHLHPSAASVSAVLDKAGAARVSS